MNISDKFDMLLLIKTLNDASSKYYNGGESPFSDKQFDNMLAALKELEEKTGVVYSNSPTQNVGAPVLGTLNEVEIVKQPMLSLDKVHTAEEIANFQSGYDIIASIKCDGLSVRLIYKDGNLVSANTRGNGYIGSDITNHVKQFLNVPLKIKKEGTYIIDGEAIIFARDFAIVNKNGEFKNSRNTASGALALLDMSIVKSRRLSFIAWDVIEGGKYNLYHYNIEEAESLGFKIPPMMAIDATCRDRLDEIEDVNNDLISMAKEMGIPYDGVVWRINDIEAGRKMGKTAHHFLNAVAWKPANEEYETRLKYIDYDVSRMGILTPVAVFEPIDIDGSTVERASLHNMSIMKEVLGETPYAGQPVWVIKANMIIPQITRAIKKDYGDIIAAGGCTVGLGGDYGVLCPICGGLTSIRTSESGVDVLYCDNENCPGKLAQRIDHYAGKKGLDIKGISRKTIEKLIDWGWINDSISELYDLQSHRTEWISKPGFGAASVDKILNAIEESRSDTSLEKFISGIGIPLVGSTIAKEIVKYYPTWEKFREAVGSDWTLFDGFGEEINKAINNFDYTEADKIAATFAFKQRSSSVKAPETAAAFKDKVFCITGKVHIFKNRDELKADIESLGGKVVSSMSSKVNYLINNDATSTSAKNKAAQAAGIPIITEEEYVEMKG